MSSKQNLNKKVFSLNEVSSIVRKAALENFFTLDRGGMIRSGKMDPEGRDLNEECGYPDEPDIKTYRNYYEREGPATRVVNVYPDECWSIYPQLYETEETRKTKFERAWEKLEFELNPWHYLHRVDEVSGIGRFGILLMGFDDNHGGDLSRPVPGVGEIPGKAPKIPKKELSLLYLRTFPEDFVTIKTFVTDTRNPRFGQPELYSVQLFDPGQAATASEGGQATAFNIVDVHWSRVIHVADNRKQSEIYGEPRMKTVLNRLYDLRKILGGSGEMFWRGAFPGYAFESLPDDVNPIELDEDSIKEQVEEYTNGLKRYLAVTGMKVTTLTPQMGDPTQHAMTQIQSICMSIGVPMRTFMGSESGHLASTQDAGTWNRRLSRRQLTYLNPMLIFPFVKRLMDANVLPRVDNFIVSWKDLNALSDKEKADVGLKKSQAIMQYTTGGGETIIPVKLFLTLILGLSQPEADAVITELAARGDTTKTKDVWFKPKPVTGPQGGGKKGKAPRSSPGRRSSGSGGST